MFIHVGEVINTFICIQRNPQTTNVAQKPTDLRIKELELLHFCPHLTCPGHVRLHLGTSFWLCIQSMAPTQWRGHTRVWSLLMQTVGGERRFGSREPKAPARPAPFLEDWLRTILVLPANEIFKAAFGCSSYTWHICRFSQALGVIRFGVSCSKVMCRPHILISNVVTNLISETL